jgi:peptide/nickel transport system substrate-binding protein
MRKRLFGLLASAAIIAAACTSGTPTTVPSGAAGASGGTGVTPTVVPSGGPSVHDALFGSKYAPGAGQPGGTLVFGEWQAPDSLMPFFESAFADSEALGPVMRGLLTLDADGKYINDLGDGDIPTTDNGGVVVNPDGKTFDVKVKIKPNLQWSDGQKLDLNDFKYTWQWSQDPAQTGCTGCVVGWKDIGGIDVSADGLSATIHFKDLYAGWLAFLTSDFLPQHYFANIAVKDAAKSMPAGPGAEKIPWSGPFMITSATAAEIDYAPNPNWHAGVGGAHAPYLAGLKFQFFADVAGEIAAFKAGSIDVALDMTVANFPDVNTTDPSVGMAEVKPAWQYEHLDIQGKHTDKGLDKPDVRKAIEESINRPELLNVLFPGANVPPACSPAPIGIWYRDETITCPAYNPDDAKALLASSGFTPGADGNLQYQGKTVDLQLCTTAGNPTRLTELQKLQGYLAAVGLKSHIETEDATTKVFATWADSTPTTACSIYRGNYDIADYAYIIGADIYGSYFYTYDSSQFPEDGDHSGANTTRFSNPDMDAALADLKSQVDLTKQFADAQTLQKVYVDNTPEIALYYRSEVTGVGVHVGNWPTYNVSTSGPTWNVEDLYFKP